MEFRRLSIPEVILVVPDIHEDERGFFFESYRQDKFAENGIATQFVQDNHSKSAKGILRGLHFQSAPHEQAKLVRVGRGEIYDVAIDIRPESSTFGKWVGATLSTENRHMLYIPEGFAHGFLALEDGTEVIYKASDVYAPECEGGIIWNDSKINIDWPQLGTEYILSEKDKVYPTLDECSL